MQKWEYCIIDGIGNNTLNPHCYLLTENGKKLITNFKDGSKLISEEMAVGLFIAKLGDEGWELVCAGNIHENYHTLYFKRTKQ